ncbi:hypothetical protein, partial [Umezawaea sp. NPDC059074]|uniref:hypothetical protein n=1 Tax=Umezawaea sp. NPDC059074 TaxID=3346716 RepID=UPI0036CF5FB9
MRIAKTALGVGLAAGVLLGGAAQASADVPLTASTVYDVTTWHDVNMRHCASTTCAITGHVAAGTRTIAYCWRHGQSITDAGITNDIWVKGSLEDGGQRYMSAVYP